MTATPYKTHPGRMTFGELFRLSGSPLIGSIWCVRKALGLLRSDSTGNGLAPLGARLIRIAPPDAPPQVLAGIARLQENLSRLNFEPGFVYPRDSLGPQELFGLARRHRSVATAALAGYSRSTGNGPVVEQSFFSFVTPLSDDTIVITLAAPPLTRKPRHFRMAYVPSLSPAEALDYHQKQLDVLDARPTRVKGDDELERLVVRVENDEFEFNVARGVYVPMTEAEIERGRPLGSR